MEFEHVKPMDIEKRSMEIIGQELAEMGISLPADKAHIIKRVIHTSADFDYAQTLTFSEDALERATDALKQGASIITDTKMAWSGINKRALENLGGQAYNFISDEDVAAIAKEKGCTRAAASIDKAANLNGPLIFAVGNAPTALCLVRLLGIFIFNHRHHLLVEVITQRLLLSLAAYKYDLFYVVFV